MYGMAARLNTVDVFMAVVIATIICIGRRGGIISESIKLLGIFCTIFIALHYYIRLADYLKDQFIGPDAATEFFAFSLLAILAFVAFIFISHGWVLILKIKIPAAVNRWGGLALSLARSYFTCGLLFFMLLLAQHEYATTRAQQSVSRVIFRSVAADLYKAAYATLIEDFFPEEKVNLEVFEIMAGKQRKTGKR